MLFLFSVLRSVRNARVIEQGYTRGVQVRERNLAAAHCQSALFT